MPPYVKNRNGEIMYRLISSGIIALFLMAIASLALAECKVECTKKEIEEDGYCYEVFKGPDKDDEAIITGYIGTGGDLVLPDTLGGLPVTVINNNAFDGCDTITCITTGNNVWLVQREAFANMPNLACTYISDSVTTIKESVWKNDVSLGTVVFGSGVEVILNRTLCPCPSLTDVYFLGDAPRWAPGSVFCQETQTFSLHITDGATGFEEAIEDGFNVTEDSEPECLTDSDCSAGYVCSCAVCETPSFIELGSLDAIWEEEGVVVSWVTDTEIDNAYFNLYRAESIKTAKTKKRHKKNFLKKISKWLKKKKAAKKGPYVKINAAPIPALGESPYGAFYEVIDTDVVYGKRYWYKLEDVDLFGLSTQHGPCGPVSAWEDCSYMP
jgi:hypothetical protein